jgi:hypothetical protein
MSVSFRDCVADVSEILTASFFSEFPLNWPYEPQSNVLYEFGFDHLSHSKLNSRRTNLYKFCETWLVLTLNLHYTFYKKKTVALFKCKTKKLYESFANYDAASKLAGASRLELVQRL